MTRDLPPLDFMQTHTDRRRAAWMTVYLDHLRRQQNARDAKRSEIRERTELEAALEAL